MEDNKIKYDLGKEVAGLFPLYDEVKKAIILAERLGGRISLGAVNEIRNVADHIFKASQENTPDGADKEIKKIKEHLNRAGYDACEIIVNQTILYVVDTLKPYSNDCIVSVFPEYYQEIRPAIDDMQSRLVNIRATKKEAEEDFERYYNEIQVLLKYRKEIETHIKGLAEFSKKAVWKLVQTAVITFLTTVAAGLLVYFFTC